MRMKSPNQRRMKEYRSDIFNIIAGLEFIFRLLLAQQGTPNGVLHIEDYDARPKSKEKYPANPRD